MNDYVYLRHAHEPSVLLELLDDVLVRVLDVLALKVADGSDEATDGIQRADNFLQNILIN